MSGLFSSLSMAARSLEAQRAGLDVAGQNIANLNTPGYRNFVVGIIINIPNCVPPTPSAANTAGG